jgi:uncharacterized protein
MDIFHDRLAWSLAGPSRALLVVALQWTANLPLGATGAIASLPTWFRGRQEPTEAWRLWFFAGMILGGFFFAQATGAFHPDFAHGQFDAFLGRWGLVPKAAILAGAGILIGFGARTAGGCTSGHGICGFSRGSTGSMVATVVFVAAAIVTANLVRWGLGG